MCIMRSIWAQGWNDFGAIYYQYTVYDQSDQTKFAMDDNM